MSGAPGRRLLSIDALRGLIMVIMALDHAAFWVARVHPFEFWSEPLPDYGSVSWFLTRWITHLCAPGFFFLMGTGMSLLAASRRDSGWTDQRITSFFLKRGIALIVVSYAFEILPASLMQMAGSSAAPLGPTHYVVLGVLVTLGISMALCGALMRLSIRTWLATAFIAIMAPNFLIPTLGRNDGSIGAFLRLFFVPGETGAIMSIYPIIPWFGMCALGVGFGQLVRKNEDRALRAMLPMGLAYLMAFIGIRFGGGFGNMRIPAGQGWMDFLTVVKYPPSLAFTTLMLGLNLVLLSTFHQMRDALEPLLKPLAVFGQAPLFFYILHMHMYAWLRVLVFSNAAPPQWVLYVSWLAVVALLYPACKWFRARKLQTPEDSLWRMF